MRINILTIILNFFFMIPFISYSDTTLKGDFVKGDYKAHIFKFKGHVQFFTSTFNLKSDELTYYEKQKKIIAENNLILNILKDDIQISGETLQQQNGFITVIGSKKKQVSLIERSSQTLYCDKLTAIEKNGSLIEIQFLGNPHAKSNDSNIIAEKILYTPQSKKLELLGKSTIQQKRESQTIDSKDILIDKVKDSIEFNNPVSFIDKDQNYLSANKGIYYSERDILSLSGKVNYLGKNMNINSDLLNTKKQKKDTIYDFSKNIGIQYKTFKGSSDSIFYNKNKKILTLLKHVHLKNDEHGLIIDCSTMDVKETEKKFYLYKNIVLTSKNKVLKGDVGEYDDKTKIFSIWGNATYNDSENTYTAEKIILDNNTSEVKMEGNIKGETALSDLQGVKVEKDDGS